VLTFIMNFDITCFEVFNSIKFHSKDHTYKVNGEVTPLSCTRFLNLFVPEFDRDNIAKQVAKRNNVHVDQVISEWTFEKDVACFKGTLLHNYIDNYLNKKIMPLDKNSVNKFFNNDELRANEFLCKVAKLILQFHKFYEEYYRDNFIYLKSEFVVGDVEDTNICGTIDNLSICKQTNKLFIIDYKTNKKIDNKTKYTNLLKCPIQHLENTKYNIYNLQTSFYRHIIEKYTSIPTDSFVVWFNENNDSYKIIKQQDMISNVVDMINYYKNNDSNRTIPTLTTATEDYIASLGEE
jgi:ATP-dependent exoDNAse (exonuclease V) beta subunit